MEVEDDKSLFKGSLEQLAKKAGDIRGEVIAMWKNVQASKMKDAEKQVDSIESALDTLRNNMGEAVADLDSVTSYVQLSTAEAAYKSTIVNAWPPHGLADKVLYLGTALLGVGSAAFALLGFPLGLALAPALMFWTLGILFVVGGLFTLARWERMRRDYFMVQFDIAYPKPGKMGHLFNSLMHRKP